MYRFFIFSRAPLPFGQGPSLGKRPSWLRGSAAGWGA
jgi:hypothetical protein